MSQIPRVTSHGRSSGGPGRTVPLFRVFLSSPGDVAEERARAREVLIRLQRKPLLRERVTIDVVSWNDPDAPAPMLAGLPPQDAVNRGLPTPSECDLTIVVLWARMGTPLADLRKTDGTPYRSGTEWEYLDALSAGKPVLLYHKTARVQVDLDDPEFDDKRAQKKLVGEFFATFAHPDGSLSGSYTPFETTEQFAARLEQDVESEIGRLIEGPAAAALRPAAQAPVVTTLYREWLKVRSARVELLGLRLRQGQSVRLGNVYVPLATPVRADEGVPGPADRTRRGDPRPDVERDVPALLLRRLGDSSLYVPGDAGSGKSTFCRWVAWLVCEGAVPPPDVDTPHEWREALPEALRTRLPLLVPLRELWQRLPVGAVAHAFGRVDLEQAIAEWIDRKAPDGLTGADAVDHLAGGTTLLMLDGIDEVPASPRAALINALADAVPAWTTHGNRLLVTSRPYGLTPHEISRLSLPVAPLLALSPPLQQMLVQRWFRLLEDTVEKGDATAGDLLTEIGDQDWLSTLAENPLLLTAICIVYGQGRRLPQDRHELYDEIVTTVLHSRIEDKSRQALVRDRLAVVAHGMHTGAGLGISRETPQADVGEAEIDRMLRDYQERSSWSEAQKREVRDDRDELLTQTGVLLPRDEHRAAFYHLSFQEFLAAERCAEIEAHRLADLFADRGRTPEWRSTLSFVFGRVLRHSSPEPAVRLLADVVGRLDASAASTVVLAADCLEILAKRGLDRPVELAGRLRDVALEAMRGNAPARERCLLGDVAALLGDTRFDASGWFLPVEDLLGFVEVPAGPFLMGSDKGSDGAAYDNELPQHRVDIGRYYLAKYPVTVAQFAAFVHATGFSVADRRCLSGAANHPVVFVTWHEALAYADWLTSILRSWPETPEPLAQLLRGGERPGEAWRVTLPSEAEWEKAARGPHGAIYPWGDDADSDRANYAATGINGTSAVGCFPRGASPYDVEELSGNVWEWTRSLWGEGIDATPYSYEPSRRREDLRAGADIRRVVRGGAFLNSAWYVRAACRGWSTPDPRGVNVGFRVVVSPFSSDL